jgi:hypothetical protein
MSTTVIIIIAAAAGASTTHPAEAISVQYRLDTRGTPSSQDID